MPQYSSPRYINSGNPTTQNKVLAWDGIKLPNKIAGETNASSIGNRSNPSNITEPQSSNLSAAQKKSSQSVSNNTYINSAKAPVQSSTNSAVYKGEPSKFTDFKSSNVNPNAISLYDQVSNIKSQFYPNSSESKPINSQPAPTTSTVVQPPQRPFESQSQFSQPQPPSSKLGNFPVLYSSNEPKLFEQVDQNSIKTDLSNLSFYGESKNRTISSAIFPSSKQSIYNLDPVDLPITTYENQNNHIAQAASVSQRPEPQLSNNQTNKIPQNKSRPNIYINSSSPRQPVYSNPSFEQFKNNSQGYNPPSYNPPVKEASQPKPYQPEPAPLGSIGISGVITNTTAAAKPNFSEYNNQDYLFQQQSMLGNLNKTFQNQDPAGNSTFLPSVSQTSARKLKPIPSKRNSGIGFGIESLLNKSRNFFSSKGKALAIIALLLSNRFFIFSFIIGLTGLIGFGGFFQFYYSQSLQSRATSNSQNSSQIPPTINR